MPWLRLLGALTVRSLRSPTLVPALLTTAWRFRTREWYLRPPFLPLPDRRYLRWRMFTAFGDESAVPSAAEVERYARWASKT